MRKILFIDRDGTIIREPDTDFQIDTLEKFAFIPRVITYLEKIVKELDYDLVMVSNQDGLGTESFPDHTFWPYQELMIRTLESEGIQFEGICIDRSLPGDGSPYRKPGIAMLTKYMDDSYDLDQSFVIGDRWSDCELAMNLGAKGIIIRHKMDKPGLCPEGLRTTLALNCTDWKAVYSFLKKLNRKSKITRVTAETSSRVCIDLDGDGQYDNHTGLKFFDHMLDQLARHGGLDLEVSVKGDLEVDEHHTIEDTAIALGTALKSALGNKTGLARYGFCLPMDDCLAQVALDFGGRPWIEWQVDFSREKIGDVPTEMFFHFFKSLSDHACCNLNIKAEGDNEHHKIESIFKAFGRALKMAKVRDMSCAELPSTKGVL